MGTSSRVGRLWISLWAEVVPRFVGVSPFSPKGRGLLLDLFFLKESSMKRVLRGNVMMKYLGLILCGHFGTLVTYGEGTTKSKEGVQYLEIFLMGDMLLVLESEVMEKGVGVALGCAPSTPIMMGALQHYDMVLMVIVLPIVVSDGRPQCNGTSGRLFLGGVILLFVDGVRIKYDSYNIVNERDEVMNLTLKMVGIGNDHHMFDFLSQLDRHSKGDATAKDVTRTGLSLRMGYFLNQNSWMLCLGISYSFVKHRPMLNEKRCAEGRIFGHVNRIITQKMETALVGAFQWRNSKADCEMMLSQRTGLCWAILSDTFLSRLDDSCYIFEGDVHRKWNIGAIVPGDYAGDYEVVVMKLRPSLSVGQKSMVLRSLDLMDKGHALNKHGQEGEINHNAGKIMLEAMEVCAFIAVNLEENGRVVRWSLMLSGVVMHKMKVDSDRGDGNQAKDEGCITGCQWKWQQKMKRTLQMFARFNPRSSSGHFKVDLDDVVVSGFWSSWTESESAVVMFLPSFGNIDIFAALMQSCSRCSWHSY